MRYVTVPQELPLSEIRAGDACFSPGRYVRFRPPKVSMKSNFVPLDKLIVLRDSRIVVKKDKTYQYAEIGDIDVGTGGIVFRTMLGYRLPTNRPSVAQYGDILVSTVRTYRKGIGYVADDGDNLVTTNAVLNVCGVTDFAPNLTLLYVYSFLRTDFFVEQVWSMLNRGLYPRMDKGAIDKILIPVSYDERVIRYVSVLMQAIVEKEKALRGKSDLIHELIQSELKENQKRHQFQYLLPSISEVLALGRLDAAIHGSECKSKIWLIHNYLSGFETPKEAGFIVTPGPSLEIKILRTRINSEQWRKDYYFLITPTNISEWGTIAKEQFIGTAKHLPVIKKGDIIFGESGSHRSLVFLGVPYNAVVTTNAHGLYARRNDENIARAVFFRCIFDWLYKSGVIDLLSVGGSGRHFSPEYFEMLPIPKFPEDKQYEIARLYHHEAPPPLGKSSLDTFTDWHRRWNTELGIWELDREMKALHRTLSEVQEKIIEGKTVNVPLLETIQ